MNEFLKKFCLMPGQIENWSVITNVKKFGITEIPLKVGTLSHVSSLKLSCYNFQAIIAVGYRK
jgi:hypothetical protein